MHSTDFDNELKEIEHYKRYPSLMPFIGENYGTSTSKKVLLIAESHYLPEDSIASLDAAKWYTSTESDLTSEEINWISTRTITSCDWGQPGHKIFRELESRMSAHIEKCNGRAMNSCAFMNAFQRPSPDTGESIKNFCSEQDISVSEETISKVVQIINPDLVLFTSKTAWDYIG